MKWINCLDTFSRISSFGIRWICNGFLVEICIFTAHLEEREVLLSSLLEFSFLSPPSCDPGSAKISLLALFSHRHYSCSPFFSHQYSLLKITLLCHTWVPLIHNTAPRIPADREIFSVLKRYIGVSFKSRCALTHRQLSTTNKQQHDIQKLLFLKILFKSFPTKAKKVSKWESWKKSEIRVFSCW